MKPPKLDRRAMASLGHAVTQAGALRGKHIGAPLRERIILHVSSVNSCVVCSATHGAVGRAVGLDREDIRAARAVEPPVSLDERTRVALRYAEVRTRGEEDAHPEDVRRLEVFFDEAERREIGAIVDMFTFANRFNNSWEAVLPGATARRRKLFEREG